MPTNLIRASFLSLLICGFLPTQFSVADTPSIEVDPKDQLELSFDDQTAHATISGAVTVVFRPFTYGELREPVKILRFGIPYVMDAQFDAAPDDDLIKMNLVWSGDADTSDPVEFRRLSTEEGTSYRAVKLIVLQDIETLD